MTKPSSTWRHETLLRAETLSDDLLMAMFHGEIPALRISGFYSEDELQSVRHALAELVATQSRYDAIDLGTPLGESHWGYQYTGKDWSDYFERARVWEMQRKAVFAQVGDPVDRVQNMLASAWHGRVGRARHPRTGQQLFAGLVRSGAPALHFDWARFDLPGLDCIMQAGWNVYLSNPGTGGNLRVYRVLGMRAGNLLSSGKEPVGNYGLPNQLVQDAEYDIVPCRSGDFVMTPNRFLHEVTRCRNPENRLSVAAHVVWLRDGGLAQFS